MGGRGRGGGEGRGEEGRLLSDSGLQRGASLLSLPTTTMSRFGFPEELGHLEALYLRVEL
jgi:hypothetical protein